MKRFLDFRFCVFASYQYKSQVQAEHPKVVTYARSRLWLGICNVGCLVLLSLSALWLHLPQRFLVGLTPLSAIALTLGCYIAISLPFDLLGGYILPRRYQRTTVSFPLFSVLGRKRWFYKDFYWSGRVCDSTVRPNRRHCRCYRECGRLDARPFIGTGPYSPDGWQIECGSSELRKDDSAPHALADPTAEKLCVPSD